MGKPLNERLRQGHAALARHGDFWYPVRLIHKEDNTDNWRVKWWRGCDFKEAGIEPGSVTTVPLLNVVDCLWQDRVGRRKIRVRISIIYEKLTYISYTCSLAAGPTQARFLHLKTY